MFVCPHCRIEYEEDKKFCKKCGAALGFRAAKKNCPDCLIEYEPDKKFCRKCGRTLDPGPVPSGLASERGSSPIASEKRGFHVGGQRAPAESPRLARGDAGIPSDGLKAAASTAMAAQALGPANHVTDKMIDKSTPGASGASLPSPKPRPWYAVLVPIMMWLYALGLLVPAITAFSVDGLLYFYDDEVRMGWAMLIGCIVSVVTGIVLWRHKPKAGVFVAAVMLLLGLVPFLVVLFSFLNNL